MKPLLILLLFFITLSTSNLQAQDAPKLTWAATAEKLAPNQYKITYNATIAQGWHLYALHNKQAELTALETLSNDSTLTFSQRAISSTPTTIIDALFDNASLQVFKNGFSFTEVVNVTGTTPAALSILLKYNVAQGTNFIPEDITLAVPTGQKVAAPGSHRILIPTINLDKPITTAKTSDAASANNVASKGLLAIFGLGFLGGLIALVTPCVFPMIPLTVSFFTKKAQSKKLGIRNAFLYGFFIFLIYILVTVPFHIFDKLNPDIFNGISTNVVLNIIFFIIFVAFALSFFGLFEITLPSSFTNGADSKANAATITGIFFMALTLTIVSFSCTGPLAGSLLAGAVSGPGGAMRLSVGMAGFGAALGLPFALFALFPEMLKQLPKSGGWLTTVKVVLGFLELGLAFKFLSNADQVMHWGLLKREVFIGIWIIIGTLLSLYLWGIFRFKNDGVKQKLSAGRKIIAAIFTLFTLYLLPGITHTKYANLTLISGFPPPLNNSIYTTAASNNNNCVLNLNCAHDYEQGLKMAKEQNKAILLDFTGYACVNCRRMEENVWSQPQVYNFLKENFIVVSLYVDDKKNLPAEQRFTYTSKDGAVRNIKTVGDKWSVFETENFKSNSQPLYAIINTKEELLSHPSGYAPTVQDYLNWLQKSVGK